MTKTEPARSMDELLVCVESMLVEHPQSKKLKSARTNLKIGRAWKKRIYILPILGIGSVLFGAFLAISNGDWEVLVGFGVLGAIAALSFFPIRLLMRWELKKGAQKVEKLLADFEHQST